MKRKSNPRRARSANALPPEIGILLDEIEKEPVPEKLLTLAQQLQQALSERRRLEDGKEATDPEAVKRLKRSR